MAIFDAIGRIGAGLLEMVGTRLELAAVEMEEETQRLLGYFVMAFAALILSGIALVLVALTVIMIFWDTARLQAAIGLIVVFGGAAAIFAFKLKSQLASRPRFMAATVNELNKDVNFVRNVGASND